MRKFKHKPSGNLAEWDSGNEKYMFGNQWIPNWLIENSADWEEVVEKECEILSFNCQILSGEVELILLRNSGNCFGNYCVDEETLLKSNIHKIHSVKRLSDGEVFKLGDLTTKGVIHGFEFIGDVFSVSVGDQKTLLRTFDKAKQPLFVTEDGVNIYKNQKYYGLYTKSWAIEEHENGIEYDIKLEDVADSSYLTFSTKEKAEEYILENNPCLSIADVFKVLKTVRVGEDCFKIKLEQFAKSKIQ